MDHLRGFFFHYTFEPVHVSKYFGNSFSLFVTSYNNKLNLNVNIEGNRKKSAEIEKKKKKNDNFVKIKQIDIIFHVPCHIIFRQFIYTVMTFMRIIN